MTRTASLMECLERQQPRQWSWEGTEDDDASYFVMKQELMLAYCTNLSFYKLLKARGVSIRDHPVLDRLYEMRVVFEKMRLIETKLRHQLDTVLARHDAHVAQPRPKPQTMRTMGGGDDEDRVYRAPRLRAVAYPGDKKKTRDDDSDDDDDDFEEDSKKPTVRMTRARRTEMMNIIRDNNDMVEQTSSTGGAVGDVIGTGAKAARRERLAKEAKDQARFEESRFMRVISSKKQKKKRKLNPFSNTIDDLI